VPGAIDLGPPTAANLLSAGPRVDETELSTIRSDLTLLQAASHRVAAEFTSMGVPGCHRAADPDGSADDVSQVLDHVRMLIADEA